MAHEYVPVCSGRSRRSSYLWRSIILDVGKHQPSTRRKRGFIVGFSLFFSPFHTRFVPRVFRDETLHDSIVVPAWSVVPLDIFTGGAWRRFSKVRVVQLFSPSIRLGCDNYYCLLLRLRAARAFTEDTSSWWLLRYAFVVVEVYAGPWLRNDLIKNNNNSTKYIAW